MRHINKGIPFLQKLRIWLRQVRYPGVAAYWERRYARGGRSGAGSLGEVARFKADFLNAFVERHRVASITELGCGDGDQLALARYPAYKGLDIAPTAVRLCQEQFAGDASKQFAVYVPDVFEPASFRAEMAISLEVIFHLTEEEVYRLYMQHLFALGERWVVIFASNTPDISNGVFPHFRTRVWLPDVPEGWVLREQVVCDVQTVIPSSFFVFERSYFEA